MQITCLVLLAWPYAVVAFVETEYNRAIANILNNSKCIVVLVGHPSNSRSCNLVTIYYRQSEFTYKL